MQLAQFLTQQLTQRSLAYFWLSKGDVFEII